MSLGVPGIGLLGKDAVSSQSLLKAGRSEAKCLSGKLTVLKLVGRSKKKVFNHRRGVSSRKPRAVRCMKTIVCACLRGAKLLTQGKVVRLAAMRVVS